MKTKPGFNGCKMLKIYFNKFVKLLGSVHFEYPLNTGPCKSLDSYETCQKFIKTLYKLGLLQPACRNTYLLVLQTDPQNVVKSILGTHLLADLSILHTRLFSEFFLWFWAAQLIISLKNDYEICS